MATNNILNFKTVGLAALNSAGTITGRSIAVGANNFSISNASGAGGNPTIGFATVVKYPATQPLVLAYNPTTTAAVTGDGTVYTVLFTTETLDDGGNYNNGTGIFTAPIDGNYSIMGNVGFRGLGTSTSVTSLITITPIATGTPFRLSCASSAAFNVGNNASIFCPFQGVFRLLTGDTMNITAIGAGGTKTNTILGAAAYATFLTINLTN